MGSANNMHAVAHRVNGHCGSVTYSWKDGPHSGTQGLMRRESAKSKERFTATTKRSYPSTLRLAVTGRKGEHLREIIMAHNVEVTYEPIQPSSEAVVVSGRREFGVLRAAAALDKRIEALELDEYAKATLPVPTFFRDHLKRYYTPDVVLKMSEDFDVYITVKDPEIFIAGASTANVEECKNVFIRAMALAERKEMLKRREELFTPGTRGTDWHAEKRRVDEYFSEAHQRRLEAGECVWLLP
ncbi:hypothetical protein AAVH_38618 [Aphelenchoides avenae]|nr:hypothetical protein AAVH_38618 [Aphelenchus avenae]